MRYIMRRICLFLVMIAVIVLQGVAEEKRRSGNRYIVACIWRTDRIAIKRSD